MDAEVAFVEEEAEDGVRNRADAELERRAVGNERRDVRADLRLDGRDAAIAASADVPTVQKPCLSGGESCRMAASSVTRPLVKRSGMSDRNTGVKSARPSSIAFRSPGPVKSEFDRNRGAHSGSANRQGPSRWRCTIVTSCKSRRAASASSSGNGVAAAP